MTNELDEFFFDLEVGWEGSGVGDVGRPPYVVVRPGAVSFDSSTFSVQIWKYNHAWVPGGIGHCVHSSDLFEQFRAEILHGDKYRVLEVLPDRMIGGEVAHGLVYEFTSSGWHLESWFVARRDGLWEIQLFRGRDEAAVPAALYRMLDSLRWVKSKLPRPSVSESQEE